MMVKQTLKFMRFTYIHIKSLNVEVIEGREACLRISSNWSVRCSLGYGRLAQGTLSAVTRAGV